MQGWTLCFIASTICRLSRSGLSPCFFDGRKPAQAVFTNVMGTKKCSRFALRHQVEKFVMVSTDRAVNLLMGASKRIAGNIHSMFYSSQSGGNKTTKFITTRLGSAGSIVLLFSCLTGKLPMAVQSRLLILKVSVIL
jgi:hypothetical protein